MEAGHSTQQHSNLAVLYPRSKSLQTNIVEFFTVVVRICLRFHQYTQKSALARFASSLDDSDIKELRSSLIAWSKSIQEEITTLVAQTVETEAESNSRFRALMSLNVKKTSEQQRQIALRKIRKCYSTYDYETPWRQIRKAGNTCLYKELPQYNQWIVAPASKTLILVEKLGYGKSVTLANIVDDLNLRIDPEACGLAYFFCRHDIPESKHAETIMGALSRQIISPLEHLLDESQVMDLDSLPQPLGLMPHVVPSGYVLYIVVDGLDICSPSERKRVTARLELMATHFNVHLCISRRLEPGTELQSIAKDFPKATIARLPDNASDIETYVDAQLEAALLEEKLVLGEPTIILEITNALLDGSQHMFLWVALQIQSLCMMQTDHDIRKALVKLPQDLSEIYSQILQQAKCVDQALRSNIFKLILAARRPLTLPEMRDALSVTPGDTTWDPSKLLNSIYPALATCGCLITVDEEEHTIRTVHPSVDQFLLQDDFTSPDIVPRDQFTMEDARSLMSSIIITYLGYGIFGTELAVRRPVFNVGSVPDRVMESTKHGDNDVLAATLKMLRSRKKTKFDASHTFVPNLRSPRPPTMDDFLFQHYAKPYALQHLSDLPAVSCATAENLLRMLKNGAMAVQTDEEAIGLLWLMLQPPGRADVVELLTHLDLKIEEDTSAFWAAPETLFGRLFYSAIANGHTQAIKYLMDLYHLLINRQLDGIQPGANSAFPALMEFYLQHTLRSRKCRETSTMVFFLGDTPLCHAIEHYQDRALEILMGYDVFDINKGETLRKRPIGVAAEHQNIGALKILLSAEHRGKLQMTLAEAEELTDLVAPIEDDSIPSLLNCIKAVHPNASLASGRRR
ncbi:hypothetical protein J4E83_010022 [Alternaria metachromatica]|uniref:uncharacterized protein n=1 Tax=Alternaria metachromatica TaxID=283354 RepID=UPI0020C1F178|nr:uncharacterized protein J4E83_010022 [Alternaria metachromatica]KAI4606650.1 hypothetical protein J4E83_010022 [Alternaria metachromatica]